MASDEVEVAVVVIKMGPDRWKIVDEAEDPVAAISTLGLSDLEAVYHYDSMELDYVQTDARFQQSARDAYLNATRGGLFRRNAPRSVKLQFEVPGTRDKKHKVRND